MDDVILDQVALAAVNQEVRMETIGFKSIVVHLMATAFAGTLVYEQSMDGRNWLAVPGQSAAGVGAGSGLSVSTDAFTTTANVMRRFPAFGRFFRVRCSVRTSGSINVLVMGRSVPMDAPNAFYLGSAITLPTEFRASATASGATSTRVKSAASTNLTLIRNTACNLFDAILSNNNAADRFIKFYNKASAPLATDVPLFTMLLPAKQVTQLRPQVPVRFSTGLGYSITGAIADNDATAVAVDDVTGVLNWA